MSSALANFHFIRPEWLLLLPLVAGVWWMWQRYVDPLRGWREQISPELLRFMISGPRSEYRKPAIWLLACWVFIVVAITGPTWRLEESPFAEDASPLMILLKADSSMEQSDLEPSRLEHARLKIADLAKARKGQPLGLIAYAGSAHLVLPPTRDTEVVADMAAEISPAVMPAPGDRLDLAIDEAVRILQQGQQGGSILVITDTVDTDRQLLKNVDTGSIPIQFLTITATPEKQSSVARAADILDGDLQQLTADGSDITSILRRAASRSLSARDAMDDLWQEMGYWFVPVIGLMVLLGFRRQKIGEEV
ncbi:vWA domain-containing protein [Desulfopila aestuarii]|uniref:Ca-activated chloride channel family protein n=1 Tax=Desulfopila aestuarii DSM 18488 TaxID=1121416 RepID=A0A1M7YF52_9BACT|nr:VWA domain-containing protein [Desulfopila aestuarii]SHO51211.1 Ca-activated chloride channel family protein [Desulfopila aestuarii DSM 18488]